MSQDSNVNNHGRYCFRFAFSIKVIKNDSESTAPAVHPHEADFSSNKTGREDIQSKKGYLFLKRDMKNVGRNKEKLRLAQVLSTLKAVVRPVCII